MLFRSFSFPVAAGFRQDSAALRDRFNAVLAQPAQSAPATTAPAAGEPLRVGVSNVGKPFVFLENGEWKGSDIDIVRRFAAASGRPLQLVSMDFGALIASLQSGKVDIIISSIYVTPERQKQILFSNPYFEMATVAFARKSQMAAHAGAGAAPTERSLWASIADSYRRDRKSTRLNSSH